MSMNKKLSLPRLVMTNFKQFKAGTEIILAPITILVGPNGGGKSSITSAIRLFSLSVRYLYNNDEEAKSAIGKIIFDSVVSASSSNKKSFSLTYFQGDQEWMKIEYKRGQKGETRIDNFIQNISFTIKDGGLPKELNFRIKVFLNQFVKYNFEEINQIEDEFSDSLGEFARNVRPFRKFLPDSNKYLKLVKTTIVRKDDDHFKPDLNEMIIRIASVYYSILFKVSLIYNEMYYPESFFYWSIILLAVEEENKYTQLNEPSKIFEFLKSVFNIFETEREEWMFLIYQKLDDTRQNPPEYFEVKDGKVINDYYNLCSYLLSSENRKMSKWDLAENKELNYWLKKFEIADGLRLSKATILKLDHQFYSILFYNNGIEFDLISLSSGGKQILPIILDLLQTQSHYTNIISQPELHLHPKLQAEIADLLIHIVYQLKSLDGELINSEKPNNSIVLETHSEHIIRKLQLLVARKKANCEHIALYYIKPDQSSQTSKAILLPINEKGLFEKKWPEGFFSESTILTLDLLEELSKRQN